MQPKGSWCSQTIATKTRHLGSPYVLWPWSPGSMTSWQCDTIVSISERERADAPCRWKGRSSRDPFWGFPSLLQEPGVGRSWEDWNFPEFVGPDWQVFFAESLDSAASQLPKSPKAGVAWEPQVLMKVPVIQKAQLSSTVFTFLSHKCGVPTGVRANASNTERCFFFCCLSQLGMDSVRKGAQLQIRAPYSFAVIMSNLLTSSWTGVLQGMIQ